MKIKEIICVNKKCIENSLNFWQSSYDENLEKDVVYGKIWLEKIINFLQSPYDENMGRICFNKTCIGNLRNFL